MEANHANVFLVCAGKSSGTLSLLRDDKSEFWLGCQGWDGVRSWGCQGQIGKEWGVWVGVLSWGWSVKVSARLQIRVECRIRVVIVSGVSSRACLGCSLISAVSGLKLQRTGRR